MLSEQEKTVTLQTIARAAYRTSEDHIWFEFFIAGVPICHIGLCKVTSLTN